MVCEWFTEIFKCFKVVRNSGILGSVLGSGNEHVLVDAVFSAYSFCDIYLNIFPKNPYWGICPNLFCPILKFLSQSYFPHVNSLFLAKGLLTWDPELLCREILSNKLFIPVFFHCLNPVQLFTLLSAGLGLLSPLLSFTSSSLSWLGSVLSLFCVSTVSCPIFWNFPISVLYFILVFLPSWSLIWICFFHS